MEQRMYLLTNSHLKSSVFIGLFFLFSTVLRGQNLVLNPSFENVNLGSLQCSWYTSAAQFGNAIANWTVPTGGSTDIFHSSLGTACYCSPFSTNGASPGQQAPRTGNSYVNIVTYGSGGCTPYREYIQGELSAPLVAGQTYEVEFYVNLPDNMSVGTNNIGVKFSTAPYWNASMCGYYTTPDLNYTGPIITDKNGWTQILFCFTPTVSGLQNFIIGNFYNDAATATVATPPGSGTTIRYFIDDVRVELAGSSSSAGTNGSVDICTLTGNVNLFDYLGGTPSNSGSWSGPSVLSGGYLGTFDPNTNNTGVYTYSTSTNACLTGSSATVTVTSSPTGDASFTVPGPFCSYDASVQITPNNSGGTWSGTGITDANLGTFDPSVAGTGTHAITHIIGGACGDTVVESIVVNAPPDATISNAGPFCTTNNAVILNAATSGGIWSGTGITNANTGEFDPSPAGSGTHIIIYSVSSNGCSSSDTAQIIVNQPVDANFNPAGPFCTSDTSVQLNPANNGGVWSGMGITDSVTGVFDPNVAGSGSHQITYSFNNGCPTSESQTITVNQTPDAGIQAAGLFCTGDAPVDLVANSTGGTWSGTGITNAALGTFSPSTAGAGNHTVSYTNSSNGCTATDSIVISVEQSQSANFTAVGPFCDGDPSIQIVSDSAGGTWSGNGITNAASGEFDPSVAGVGSHTITYTFGGACGDTQSQQVIVNALPTVTISADPLQGCLPLEVQLTGSTAANCMWDFGDGSQSVACGSVTHTYTDEGCFDVTLTLSENGCSNTLQYQDYICTETPAIAQFSFEEEQVNEEVQLHFVNESSNADSYQWDFGDGTTSPEFSPSHSYSTNTSANYTICLYASNLFDCNDEYCETIEVKEELLYFVPNSFTPDGDEFNQTFHPVFTSGFDPFDYTLYIYNRWGELIFESNDAAFGWDGTYNGKRVQDGIYTWSIEFKLSSNDKRVEKHGHVNVIK